MTDPWKNFADGRGTYMAISGHFAAAAELSRMTVWREGKRFTIVEGKTPTPCRPRFVKRKLFWGQYVLDLLTGDLSQVDGIAWALKEGTGLPLVASPLGDYIPAAMAWSTTGEYLVVSANWVGSPGPTPARVVLLDKTGRLKTVLSQTNEAAPMAVWAGENHIVIGGRNQEIFDSAGRLRKTTNFATPAVRIESTADERKLLVVEHGQLTLMDLEAGSTIGNKRLALLDASIDPEGRFIMALDLQGQIHIITADDRMLTKKTVGHPDIIRGLSLDVNQVIASFSFGCPIRTASLEALLP